MTTMNESDELFVPENDLEEKLISAQRGELSPDEFLSFLLESDLFVPSATPVGDDMAGATPLLYEREGKMLLTVFTALNRAKVVQSKASYCLSINGRELLLRMPPKHGIVVNPCYRIGLEIDPEAVLDLKVKARQIQISSVPNSGQP